MKIHHPQTWFAGIALCASLAFADTQSDIEDFKNQKQAMQSELKKLDVRIAQADSTAKDEAKRFETTKQRQKEDLERRKGELDTLQSKLALVAKDLQIEKNQQSGGVITVESAKSFRVAIAKTMAEQCQDFETLVAQSIPWDQENRLDRIRALRRDLENGSATPEEGLTRIRAIYSEETRFGDEVVLLNKPMVRKDGETVNARILRIGNQWLVYADESETKFGILERVLDKNKHVSFQWKETLSFEERAAVKLAIDVKLARKPPQMVRLPLSLSVDKEDK